jgi:hypothetical protein
MKTNALWSLITTKSVACHNWKPESYQQVINCTLYILEVRTMLCGHGGEERKSESEHCKNSFAIQAKNN